MIPHSAQKIPTAQIWEWLADIPDPEIPVISLVELGVIRDLKWLGETLEVTLTPTYSGCPATSVINMEVETALRKRGIENLILKKQISPPWTTEWMSETGKRKLREYGIASPACGAKADVASSLALRDIPCPRCQSSNTSMVSFFGSTPCKAHYRCNDCLEPFDYFKCL